MMVSRSVMALAALAVCSASFGADAVQWRVADGGNGHWYQLVHSPGIAWSVAAATSESQGGLLATLASAQENTFVVSQLQGQSSRYPWIGLKQSADGAEPATGWGWVTGEPFAWANWSPTEPNGDGVDFADEGNIWLVSEPGRPLGTWNDWTTGGPDGYIIEWSADCNNDGLVDYGQILSGELADSNGNNIPDVCDCGSDSDGDGSSDCADQCPTDPGATTKTIYFIDADGDGYGTGPRIPMCTPTLGYTTNNDDCDDTDPTAFPRAIETCGNLGVDNDCDGDPSDTTGGLPFYRDGDCDGAPADLNVTYFCAAPEGGCWIPVGPTPPAIDCDDADPTRAPGAAETCANDGVDNDCDGEARNDAEAIDSVIYYIDADSDRFGSNTASAVKSCTLIPGMVTNNADCDDTQVLYADNDGDGYGASVFVACGVPTNTDCNDADPTTYPDAPETCANDGIDNDCDGEANSDDEAIDAQTCYLDLDGDGFPSDSVSIKSCTLNCPPPWIFDCNDSEVTYFDGDGDGFGAGLPAPCGVTHNDDCNDADPTIYPGVPETCANDGIDNDCDGVSTEEEASDRSTFFRDADGDGFTGTEAALFCTARDGWEPTFDGDCNDADPTSYPGAPETCANDGIDNDCDGMSDDTVGGQPYYSDSDCDGAPGGATITNFCSPPTSGCWVPVSKWVPAEFDCNDSDATVYPGATELCADLGIDNDCDGDNSEAEASDRATFYRDADGDGSTGSETELFCTARDEWEPTNEGDCNDADTTTYPGAPELCSNLSIDNDCDGVNTEEEAVDAYTCYADHDLDGFPSEFVVFRTCSLDCPPPWIFDCDDTQFLYTDADGDGFGEGLPAPCGVPNNTDCDDGDPAIGASADVDGDGRVDCRDVELRMDLVDADLAPGGTVVVRVSAVTLQPVVHLIALQCSVQFDAQRLLLVDAVPVKGAPLPAELVQSVDQGAGTLVYALGALPPGSLSSSSALFDLVFTVRPEVDACSQDALLAQFEVAGQPATVLLAADQSPVTPSLVALAPVDFDITAPVITNVPAPMAIPADAGNAIGAVVAEPAVLADDACGEAFLSVRATLPGGAVVDGWPTGGVFPVGTTQLIWRAVDGNGNAHEEGSSIDVLPYQLLDATFDLAGAFPAGGAPFTRSIRMSVGASVSTTAVEFASVPGAPTRRVGHRTDIAVPVSSSAPCALAKDVQFSITDAGATSVSGTRYATEFTLLQGDSNDDDVVDIYDYGLWYIDVGAAARTDRSNFNADATVNNGDFGWIVLHFLRRGDGCGGALGGVEPVQRVSAKELRRRGLGALLAADINGDGWLDARDVQLGQGAAAQPVAEGSAPSW